MGLRGARLETMSDGQRMEMRKGRGAAGPGYVAGYMAMALFYCVAGVNHFLHPQMYVTIIPPYLPWPPLLVYVTGLAEILGGVGVVIPDGLVLARTRAAAGWGIVVMLVLFLQVHIYMCLYPERFPGIPGWALWVRLPLQGLLITWAWYYTRKR